MKSKAVQLLENTNYLETVIEECKGQESEEQLYTIFEYLNDLDNYQLGNSYSALMKHAKTVQNYIKKNC
jgi:hypothetical protein